MIFEPGLCTFGSVSRYQVLLENEFCIPSDNYVLTPLNATKSYTQRLWRRSHIQKKSINVIEKLA